MIATPLVSIVLPTYNRSWGLRRAVAGVLRQSWQDLEVVVVDDASTDDTADVIRSFADPRLRYYRQAKNVGVAANWGHGLSLARSPFVSFLMDDDQYAPDFISLRLAALRQYERASFVFSGYRIVPEDASEPASYWGGHYNDGEVLSGSELFASIMDRCVFIGTCLYRAETVRECWAAAEGAGEIVDHALNLRIALTPDAEAVHLEARDFMMSRHAGQVSAQQLDKVFTLADHLYNRLSHERLTAAQAKRLQFERFTSYLQWSRHECRTAFNPRDGLRHAGRAIRIRPTSPTAWRHAIYAAWCLLTSGGRPDV